MAATLLFASVLERAEPLHRGISCSPTGIARAAHAQWPARLQVTREPSSPFEPGELDTESRQDRGPDEIVAVFLQLDEQGRRDFLNNWAAVSVEAVLFALGWEGGRFDSNVFQTTFAGFCRANPGKVGALFESNPLLEPARQMALAWLMESGHVQAAEELAQQDGAALRLYLNRPETSGSSVDETSFLNRLEAKTGADSAMLDIALVHQAQQRRNDPGALQRLVRDQANHGWMSASSLGLVLSGTEPSAVLRWLDHANLPAPWSDRPRVEAFQRWLARDAQTAAQWLDTLPVGGARDILVQELCLRAAPTQPGVASAWAATIQEENLRMAVLDGLPSE